MNNKSKDYSKVLFLIFGIVVILGLVYINLEKQEKNIGDNFSKQTPISTTTENVSNTTTESRSFVSEEEIERLKNLKEIGFSFRTNDPSIIHPLTKAFVKEKNNIDENFVKENWGTIFYKDSDEIILEFKRGICCGGGPTSSVYAYANINSDLITVITPTPYQQFGRVDMLGEDTEIYNLITPDFILNSIPKFKNNIKPTMPKLQTPPGENVVDGYYYAEINNWNSEINELEIDFITAIDYESDPNGTLSVFDILMSATESNSAITLNRNFKNDLVNLRKFKVSDELANRIITEEEDSKLDQFRDYGNQIILYSWPNWFIKIEDEIITDVQMVGSAG